MNWYLDVLKNRYAQFEGRAHREEFWMYALINFLVSIAFSIVGWVIHLHFLGNLYALAVIIPNLALGARRLHDTNRSGWWQLIGLIPIVGWILLLIWFITDSDEGPNNFGPSPKGQQPAN